MAASHSDDYGYYTGSAYVFHNIGTSWIQCAKLLASDGADNDYFGGSVAISGDYAIIGAHGHDDNGDFSGAAYVYHREATLWTEQAKLLPGDGAYRDYFGCAVSISGDYAIIGAEGDDDNGDEAGAAYVFHRNGTAWVEQAKLLAGDGASEDEFGKAVCISGDHAIIGAPWDDDHGSRCGSAYAFCRTETSWAEQAKLTAIDADVGDLFGLAVAISGDYAVVGAYGDGAYGYPSGSIHSFQRSMTSWIQVGKRCPPDGDRHDLFGKAVTISGDRVIVGAPGDNDNGAGSGAAYAYEWIDIEPHIWGDLTEGALVLRWTEHADAAAYWVYGAASHAWFEPGSAPGFEYRLDVLDPGTTRWSSSAGVGDSANNWTYLIMPVGVLGQELYQSNRCGEHDFDMEIPYGRGRL